LVPSGVASHHRQLDYFQRDCYFAGVVKVSFDAQRLMRLARVARADGRLQICFPHKCAHEVLHVFQTRFNLHQELYQHRVSQQVCMPHRRTAPRVTHATPAEPAERAAPAAPASPPHRHTSVRVVASAARGHRRACAARRR